MNKHEEIREIIDNFFEYTENMEILDFSLNRPPVEIEPDLYNPPKKMWREFEPGKDLYVTIHLREKE